MKRGDSVIKLSELRLYHPECYKKDREEACEGIGKLDQQFLREVCLNLGAFKTLVDSKSIGDNKSFYEIWGKQLTNLNLLDAVIGLAEFYGSLGFLKKIRLRRRVNQYRNVLMEIASSYREIYSALRIQRHMKELFPSTGKPTIEQLKEEEWRVLNEIKKQVIEWCDELETFHKDIERTSSRASEEVRKRIQQQIQEIPGLITIL